MKPKYNFDYKNFVLVTNCFNTGDDCLFLTCNVGRGDIFKALKVKAVHFDEIYDVPENDLQFYCYDPVFGDEKLENDIRSNANKYDKNIHFKSKNYSGF